MVHLLSFLFLFSLTAQAAVTPSGVPSAGLGGYTTAAASVSAPANLHIAAEDTRWFTLYAGDLSANGGTFYPFRRSGDIYQAHATKTTYCRNIRYRTGAASGGFQLMSATATFANETASGSLTGPKYQFGSASEYGMTGGLSANSVVNEGFLYTFAATTWPGVQFGDNTQLYQVYLTCIEI